MRPGNERERREKAAEGGEAASHQLSSKFVRSFVRSFVRRSSFVPLSFLCRSFVPLSFVRSFVRRSSFVPSFLRRSSFVRLSFLPSFVPSFLPSPFLRRSSFLCSFLRSFVEVPSLLRSLVVPLFLRSLFLCLFLRRSFVVPLSFAVPLFVLRPYFHCSFFVCSLLRSGSASVEQFIILPSSCLRHPFVIPSSLLCPSSTFAVLRWTLAGS